MQICRFCLCVVEKTVRLTENVIIDGQFSLLEAVKDVVPEISVGINHDSQICEECAEKLRLAYSLRRICIHTESKIRWYMIDNKIRSSNINLTDIVLQEKTKRKPTNQDVEVIINKKKLKTITKFLTSGESVEIFHGTKPTKEVKGKGNDKHEQILVKRLRMRKLDDITADALTRKRENKQVDLPQQHNLVQNIINSIPEIQDVEDRPELIEVKSIPDLLSSNFNSTTLFNCKNPSLQIDTQKFLIQPIQNSRKHKPYAVRPEILVPLDNYLVRGTDGRSSQISTKSTKSSLETMPKHILVYPCKLCNEVKRSMEDLHKHMAQHCNPSEEKTYVRCSICEIMVPLKYKNRHQLLHSVCCRYCNDMVEYSCYDRHLESHGIKKSASTSVLMES